MTLLPISNIRLLTVCALSWIVIIAFGSQIVGHSEASPHHTNKYQQQYTTINKATNKTSPQADRLAYRTRGFAPQTDIPQPTKPQQPQHRRHRGPKIQVALLLDTSGSMSGLIHQARVQMWNLVNDLSQADYRGQKPPLEIALYEYGNSRLPARDGYVRQLSGLTRDIDFVSEMLFSLTTSGGDEYTGWVIKDATKSLEWDNHPSSLKLLFIAGNESFGQGPVGYQRAIASAKRKGIIVNTIYCGRDSHPERIAWSMGAQLGRGDTFVIDHNQHVAHYDTPMDDEIYRLSQQLNSTYIPYGGKGKRGMARQRAQDSNANRHKASGIGRSVAKASSAYANPSWDLVDKSAEDSTALDTVSEAELPATMKKMTKQQKKQYVRQKKAKRSRIQKRIKQLQGKRKAHIKALQTKNKQIEQDRSLSAAMHKTIRKQAKAKNIRLHK